MCIACLYDIIATQQLKAGRLLSREEFIRSAIVIATTPEGVAELALSEVAPVQFVNVHVQGGQPAGKPILPPTNGKVII